MLPNPMVKNLDAQGELDLLEGCSQSSCNRCDNIADFISIEHSN